MFENVFTGERTPNISRAITRTRLPSPVTSGCVTADMEE
jgi:hypothetical protein